LILRSLSPSSEHQTLLVKVPPIAVEPVPAMFVSLEVADFDDAKRPN